MEEVLPFIRLRSTTPCDEHALAQLVEALCYKLEGRGFDFQCFNLNFSLT